LGIFLPIAFIIRTSFSEVFEFKLGQAGKKIGYFVMKLKQITSFIALSIAAFEEAQKFEATYFQYQIFEL